MRNIPGKVSQALHAYDFFMNMRCGQKTLDRLITCEYFIIMYLAVGCLV